MSTKRISSRGIIVEDNHVYLIFRRKKSSDGITKEYYVVPGGGIEPGETKEEAIIRELKEELSVDVEIIKYLGYSEENGDHIFSCKILNGIPTLGGEELDRNTSDNYYEVKRMPINELQDINLLYKDKILDCIN